MDYGRSHYGVRVSQKIILPLCDHMAGSVERYRRGIALENPMLWDVERLYLMIYVERVTRRGRNQG